MTTRDVNDIRDDVAELMCKINDELDSAVSKFGKFNNAHEGYAVLLEEVDELWEEIKGQNKARYDSKMAIRFEAIQVAAMAIRIIMDCCDVK